VVNTLSYQMYRFEHGLTAAERRAADARAGEVAAALASAAADLRLRLGRVLRLRRRGRKAHGAGGAVAAPVRIMSSAR
jgi:hypothetical protein